MNNYTAAVPALNALADPHANAIAPVCSPAVAVGNPRNINDVQAATDDVESRKRLRKVDGNRVTDAEMGTARDRRHIVLGQNAVRMYPGAGAPAWFAPAMQVALQPIIHAVQALRHTESRGIARMINSNVCQDNDMIEALVDNHGTIPAILAPGMTLGMLKALPPATVDALLAAYGQVAVGNKAARRSQLCVWLGLKQGFF
ncbi:hypothetical protein H257_02820 [Aphanomyces astaci]|uniref:Uncharacterized protein n=1 Tax=Aphanomyces astaci TaxID=112090 RepID=W4H194_APHAT|nr:hypothetical protein H257_02820 [Aphanomyces astaci]ETV84923.1 hypothetical protein H257_02820 [Aphanomyces astaci]|eukprot:XP_009824941.1 hypothetical protein H257_02820 [Aphanomyces astaci]